MSWADFKQLEFWQIKACASVAGESAAAGRIERLDVLMDARLITKSDHPDQTRSQIIEGYLKPITPETNDEARQKRIKHNDAFLKELKRYGQQQ